jgi:nicotinamidase-related amidase
MGQLVRWAHEAGIVHLATVDDHEFTDPELSDRPDLESTFPPHCLRGTPGAAKIPETAQADPLPISLTPYPPRHVGALASGRRELLVLKKSFDAFSNPNLDPLLAALDPPEVILFGVADVRGRAVAFVEDAARGLSEERVAACLGEWRAAGVRFTTTSEVLASLR